MKLLITGATGYIGGRLAEALSGGHEIFGLCRKAPAGDTPFSPVVCDLAAVDFEKALPAGIDAVMHLAQSADYRDFPAKARDIAAVNLAATVPLLEYARKNGASKFVYASSGGFGDVEGESFIERRPAEPLNFYLATKFSSELLVESYREFFAPVILRLHFVYGPGQAARLVPNLIDAVENDKPVYLAGEDGNVLNPLYIDDAVESFSRALELDEYYRLNLAGPARTTIRELAGIIARELNRKPHFARLETPVRDLSADTSETLSVLGYQPSITPAEGVRRVIAARRVER